MKKFRKRNKLDIDITSRSKYFENLQRRSQNKQAEVEERVKHSAYTSFGDEK